MNSISALLGVIFLGLSLDANNDLVWDNGLKFDVTTENTGKTIKLDSGSNVFYHMYAGDFHDKEMAATQFVLCQANLDRIPWM